jgi:hypothetical protein
LMKDGITRVVNGLDETSFGIIPPLRESRAEYLRAKTPRRQALK